MVLELDSTHSSAAASCCAASSALSFCSRVSAALTPRCSSLLPLSSAAFCDHDAHTNERHWLSSATHLLWVAHSLHSVPSRCSPDHCQKGGLLTALASATALPWAETSASSACSASGVTFPRAAASSAFDSSVVTWAPGMRSCQSMSLPVQARRNTRRKGREESRIGHAACALTVSVSQVMAVHLRRRHCEQRLLSHLL